MSEMIFLVTVKLPPNPEHDPHNKVTDQCPIMGNGLCTDVTGEHHTVIAYTTGDVLRLQDLYKHITRVEEVYL